MYLYIRKSVWDKGAISLGMGVFSCPWTAEEQKWRNHECIQKYPCTRNSGCDAGWLKCLNISSSSNSLSLLPSWHLGAPACLQLPALCKVQRAVPALCLLLWHWVLCHLQPLLQLSWGVQKPSCLLPNCFCPCCAPLPMISQPVGEGSGFKLGFACYHITGFVSQS